MQAKEAILRRDETFLKQERVKQTNVQRTRIKDDVMFHFVIAVIALSSASIFLAHAVEVYLVGGKLQLPFVSGKLEA